MAEIQTPSGGACGIHAARKKGACNFCGTCRLCDPDPNCSMKSNHIGWRRRSGSTTPASSSGKRRRMTRKSSARGKHRVSLREESESGSESESEVAAMDIDGQTNKELLTALFELLGLDTKCLTRIPNYGYAASTISNLSSGEGRTAQHIHRLVSKKIGHLVCPENATFYIDKLDAENQNYLDRMKSGMSKLLFCGNRLVSTTVQSVIASSLKLEEAKVFFADQQ